MVQLKLVLRRGLVVDTPRVPVAILRDALRTPMCPDSELNILIPLGRFILQQRLPCRLIWTLAVQARDWGLHRNAIPHTAVGRQLDGPAPVGYGPGLLIQLDLDNLTVVVLIKPALRGGLSAKGRVIFGQRVKALIRRRSSLLRHIGRGGFVGPVRFCGPVGGRRVLRRCNCGRDRGCRSCGRNQLAKLSTLHVYLPRTKVERNRRCTPVKKSSLPSELPSLPVGTPTTSSMVKCRVLIGVPCLKTMCCPVLITICFTWVYPSLPTAFRL